MKLTDKYNVKRKEVIMDEIVCCGKTYKQIVDMCALIDAGGNKYEIMLDKIVEQRKEIRQLKKIVANLEVEIDILSK